MKDQVNYSKLINSIEESIEYKNNNQILLSINNWYLIKNDNRLSNANSYAYHRGCQQNLKPTPFLHWKALKCIGCGKLPPEGIAGTYSLHNMDYIQQAYSRETMTLRVKIRRKVKEYKLWALPFMMVIGR